MSKNKTLDALILAMIWTAILALALKALPASCSYSDLCPTHGISAQFTGRTRLVDRGCIYGEYRHGGCIHWNLCYCP